MTNQLPGARGMEAWHSLLQAHATLMRQLAIDLEREACRALAHFAVLAQLSVAGGELRMTELAARALISRSGMTRRVARLVDEGLVSRPTAGAGGRGARGGGADRSGRGPPQRDRSGPSARRLGAVRRAT